MNCDKIRVGEIFGNLISNAIKYNDKKEKQIEIGYEGTEAKADDKEIAFKEEREYPLFYIRDNGIGIKEEHIDRIFKI